MNGLYPSYRLITRIRLLSLKKINEFLVTLIINVMVGWSEDNFNYCNFFSKDN